VLYFGRFSVEKGLNTLLCAAQRLPDVKFVLAGSGPMADGWKLPANVQNVGFQSGESLKRWIEQATFTVHPSEWYENCPFTILESQALGTPAIGSRMGGIPELIEDGQTGLTFPAGDADALTQAIASLWEDQNKLEQMRNACLRNKPISMGTYTERLMNIYRDIGRRHASASSF
jgi:glycosyltransferase involved in cell wall biosynthesis